MSPEERRSRKVALGLAPDKPVLLFSGKLVPWKRPMDLLVAFDRAGLDGTASLLYIGDGPDRKTLEDYTSKRGLKSVRFTGFVNQRELPKYYGLGDVLVLPSSREPWGLVLNEAMACGLSVIASDAVGAAYDLLADPKCGEIFPAGDIDALAAALRRAVESPCTRELPKRVVEGFSIKAAADGIVQAALAVTAQHHNRPQK